MQLACDRNAPGAARDALGGCEEIAAVRDDALLVASELVTNAVVHSRGASGQRLEVLATVVRDSLLIAVSDLGPGDPAADLRGRADLAAHGYGQRIVEHLASRCDLDWSERRRLWAELALRP